MNTQRRARTSTDEQGRAGTSRARLRSTALDRARLVCLTALLMGATIPDSPVADAAQRGDAQAVRALLREGADVNAAQGDGMTALHWAAAKGNNEIAEMLVYAGANVAAVTRVGAYTPLHLASKGGHAAVIRTLVKAGSAVGATTSTGGATPLHFAAASGRVEAVAALLDHGADVNARESAWGQTPLMFAAGFNRAEVVKALLKRGADARITARVLDLTAREAEDRAAEKRRNDRLAALRVSAGQPPVAAPAEQQQQASARAAPAAPAAPAQPGQQQGQAAAVPYEPREGLEPLSHAAMVGRYGGLTALLLAVRDGKVAAALALLDGGANINQVSAGDQTSPLLMATLNGHFDLAKVLLERGADPNLVSNAGAAPLFATLNAHWAPKSRHPQPTDYMQQQTTYLELAAALLKAGADPNARINRSLWFDTYGDDYLGVDRMGATPFWRAAYATDLEAMRMLVAAGADPNIPTMKPPEGRRRGRGGQTEETDPSGLPPVPVGGPGAWPIHAASGIGYGEGYAGNIHRHVPDGWLPAVKYLVEELKADVNARDHNGYTPVHHAAARGDNELIQYLVSKGADVTAVSRRGQTTADMANGPVQRISPFPETVALLERLGSKNNHKCMSC